MEDIDFRSIVSRLGSKNNAFEELCCQLARRTKPNDAAYARLYGAGGDGGVECYVDTPSGDRIGWQAKYVWDVQSLIAQVQDSLDAALNNHPQMTKFVVCFPFDLTGPTGRGGVDGTKRFKDWREGQEAAASAAGRELSIGAWPASELRALLMEHDTSGGIRTFFFDETVLSPSWFGQHLESAIADAGPRYQPELNLETNLGRALDALIRGASWRKSFRDLLAAYREPLADLARAVAETEAKPPFSVPWPKALRDEAEAFVETLRDVDRLVEEVLAGSPAGDHQAILERLAGARKTAVHLERELATELEREHGKGTADSTGFRQWMAEYQVSFPAANLDRVRKVRDAAGELAAWLQSPEGYLAFKDAVLVHGMAGSGKTHAVCDFAAQRFSRNEFTCVLFGHRFAGNPDPWTRLAESVGLPIHLGRDGTLAALDAAAEASGAPLVIALDAVNETRPLRYWRDQLNGFASHVARHPNLRLLVTCRSSYLPYSAPDQHELPMLEHRGFAGMEHLACRAFFEYFGLKAPVAPILQPELANPLYLRLVCQTLKAQGRERLPLGWHSMTPVIRAFLAEKEREFTAHSDNAHAGAHVVGGGLRAIARAIANSGAAAIQWSDAERMVAELYPGASTAGLVTWLVRADLLIEDAPLGSGFGEESSLRPAFERLGDFLIAGEILQSVGDDLASAFGSGGAISALLHDDSLPNNIGILAALTISIPEVYEEQEFADLAPKAHTELVRIFVETLALRDPNTFSAATEQLVREALTTNELAWAMLDAVLSNGWLPSAIDAMWVHRYLADIPLATRDAVWCAYLFDSYEANGPVRRLTDAVFQLPLDDVEPEVAERWATILSWFCAAADRRVKDLAVRALVELFVSKASIIPGLVERFFDVDDDEVRERLLVAVYGSLLRTGDVEVLRAVATWLDARLSESPISFDNALIRDDVRCLFELASRLGALPEDIDPVRPMGPLGSSWPLQLPSDEDVERWDKNLPKLAYSCLHDDFFIYSMGCLRPWEGVMSKSDMGRWILREAAQTLEYEGSGAGAYDAKILNRFGAGRGRPTASERIGKKYQWIALFRLASRLHDHARRTTDSWAPEPIGEPLILLEERKLDPTLPLGIPDRQRRYPAWWVPASVDFVSTASLGDEEWAALTDDLPRLADLLPVIKHDDHSWRVLASYPEWTNREEGKWDYPYRNVWIRLRGYLVPEARVNEAYQRLVGRNFAGDWMPGSPSWLYAFAGEYPFGTPFNTEPDHRWHGLGTVDEGPLSDYLPASNELTVEWEYDASLLENFTLCLPARPFFDLDGIRWDGVGGFVRSDGTQVMLDPSVAESGPMALLAEDEDLRERLSRLGLGLIWTMLGEKMVVRGGVGDGVIRPFGQVARLLPDGQLEASELFLFDDFDDRSGLPE